MFPSYLRRNAIASAFGKVKSYRSNYQNCEGEKASILSQGKSFNKNPPRLQLNHNEFTVFHRNNWVWVDLSFKEQDL